MILKCFIVINENVSFAEEKGYQSLTLNFKEVELQSRFFLNTKKFYLDKKFKISALTVLLFSIIISLDMPDFHHHLKLKEMGHHFLLIISLTIYTFFLFLNTIALNSKLFVKGYKILRFVMPVCNIILNLIMFILVLEENEDIYCSLFFLYGLIFAIFFDNEYIESFIFYGAKSILFLILFIIK